MAAIDKKIQIISFLNNQNDWITTKVISKQLSISVRSLKYYIVEINDEYPNLIQSSNKGYWIDKNKADAILRSQQASDIPANYEERKQKIIMAILMENKTPTISELSDELCISPVTLQNELSKMRHELSPYHLNIHTKNEKITITGLAKDKRKLILDSINDEIKNSFFSLEKVNHIFVNVDLREIEKIVTTVLTKHEYFLDNYALFNYVQHLALTIEIRGSNPFVEVHSSVELAGVNELASSNIQAIVEEIYTALKEIYNLDYTLNDIFEASVLMMTRVVSTNVDTLSYDQIKYILGEEIDDLLEAIVNSVDETYNISLRNESFLIRFAFHLKNLLIRLEYDIKIQNLQFTDIKNNYPLIYAVSVHISNVITHKTGWTLPEDEIAYIALHVGVLMEEIKATKEKVNAIIVCPNYYSLGTKIQKRLSGIFSDTLFFSNVVTNLDENTPLDNVDLILTTEKLDSSITIPHYVMNTFSNEKDIRHIFSLIDTIKSNKIKNIIRNKIMYFFHEDLFFVDQPFQNDHDAIEKLCDVMLEKGYVDENYKQEIYEHEKISPSSYGNVAIPHPLGNKAKSSVIAVSLNPKPITWGINQVHLVFMLSLKEEDRDYFSDIFEFITKILNDETSANRLIQAKNYDDFINTLVSLY